MGARSFVVVLSLVVGLPSCHEHVALEAPSASAPVEERAAAYEDLQPLSYHQTHITYMNGMVPVATVKETDYLQLANGTRVYYPEDILPVVAEESPAATAANNSESARTTCTAFRGVAVAGWLVGGALMIAPFVGHDPNQELNLTPMLVGAGVVVGSSIIYLIGGAYSGTANDEAATAFETYDDGLRERLDLCRRGDRSARCRPRSAPAEPKPRTLDD